MDYRIKQIIQNEASQIRELAQKCKSYYSEDITPKKIIAFLLQFEDYEKIKLVLKLLFNINFLSSRKITHLIKEAYNKIDEKDKSQPMIAPLGTSQDSSALICYSLFKDIFKEESDALNRVIEVTQLESELNRRNPSSLIFIDDNITSGTQLKDFFSELLVGKAKPELIQTPLSAENATKLKKIPIYICYAIRLTKECQEIINKIKSEYNLNLRILSGADDYYNYTEFSSPIVESLEESERIKKLVIEYSKPLYEDKKWDKDKLYNRLLGYGNLGKLTVFSHNVPKSLIPFFWKTGIVNSKVWIPLFPERQELKQIEQHKYDFDIYLNEVASILLSDVTLIREPEIIFGFNPLDGTTDQDGNLTFDIPDDQSLSKVFKNLIQHKYGYDSNSFDSNKFNSLPHFPRSITRMPLPPNYNHELSEADYKNYKQYIDKVNIALGNYEKNFELYLAELSGQGKLKINISNIGIGAANHVRLRLSFNSGELIFDEPKVLISPHKQSYQVKKAQEFRYTNHSFEEAEIFKPFYYKKEISGSNLDKGMGLNLTLNFSKISHKDRQERILDYIVINRNKEYLTLKYELLWDESIEGIEGEMKIFTNKVPQSEKELSYLYKQIPQQSNSMLRNDFTDILP